MASQTAVIKKALKDVAPSKAERKKLTAVINFARAKLERSLKKQKLSAEVVVGGSVGKGTWLRGNHDIDLFVRFDLSYSNQDIGKLLGKAARPTFKNTKTLHGTRDYYQSKVKGYDLEIVPVIAIAEAKDAKNSMDASPFHIDYVANRIRANPALADEIRLLKAFAYANDVYGAESFVSGFSGYVLELLVINYGSLLHLIDAWDRARPKIIIDIEKHYHDQAQLEKTMSSSKLASPVIIVDPVLKERNACAALDEATFAKMLFALRQFKRKPSASFFKLHETTLAEAKRLSKKRGTILVYRQISPKEKEDLVHMAKLRSRLEQAVTRIRKSGISVYGHGFLKDAAYVELETLKLSKFRKHAGPPAWVSPKFFDIFIKKWPKAYIYGSSLFADVNRGFSDIRKFSEKVLREELKA
jgi:tRNA nucleotidyltransferase (CCA-adding enzyme)